MCCVASLQEFTMHDTIGCYLDLDKGQISFTKNGVFSLAIIYQYHNYERSLWLKGNINYLYFFLLCICFPLPGNDLGLAFEIPQNLRNQPFFASCVLKVTLANTSKQVWKQTNRCWVATIHICSFVF